MDAAGDYSPDGQRIVFSSDRSGNFEIWVSNSTGSNQTQLTALGGSDTGSPRWSPDGNRIAFDSRLEGHGDIFIINADGGSSRRLTSEKAENNVPTWSRDGRWVYFSSDRTGKWQIWKMPSEGGAAVQVTRSGGFIAHESQDGRTLYHWTLDGTIWSMPVQGGEPILILSGVPRYSSWVTRGNRIYFLDRDEGSARINYLDLTNHRIQQITTVDLGPSTYLLSPAPASRMFSISPDGKSIIYGRVDRLESDIMPIEKAP
jgi:Tol biopolymer transport system component